MKNFRCDHCQQLVFYENVQCVSCNRTLAYLPDLADVGSLDPAGGNLWRAASPWANDRTYRLCENYTRHNVCNWAVPANDPQLLCRACRLTRVIPNLSQAGHKQAWYRLEVAKRRLVYSLVMLGLPVVSKQEDPQRGLTFEFKADLPPSAGPSPGQEADQPVLTGHTNGVITVNIAEADDAEREKRRLALHEPYRTPLGHFRHEVGHYYWDRLIAGRERLARFRDVFGDERADYGRALQTHYQQGPSPYWQQRFISAYASAHPWEDWAETWAHYLHMTDALETAAAAGLSLTPRRRDEPSLKPNLRLVRRGSFDSMIDNWLALTYVLNNLNRGLGLPDGYPFVLSDQVIGKLRFVHETVAECAA
jgi:hypothetical protein